MTAETTEYLNRYYQKGKKKQILLKATEKILCKLLVVRMTFIGNISSMDIFQKITNITNK